MGGKVAILQLISQLYTRNTDGRIPYIRKSLTKVKRHVIYDVDMYICTYISRNEQMKRTTPF